MHERAVDRTGRGGRKLNVSYGWLPWLVGSVSDDVWLADVRDGLLFYALLAGRTADGLAAQFYNAYPVEGATDFPVGAVGVDGARDRATPRDAALVTGALRLDILFL